MIKKLLCALALVITCSGAHAAGGAFPLEKAPNRISDLAALQNGAKLFANYCLNCHAAEYMRYNRLRDIGLTEAQIKQNLIDNTSTAAAQGVFGVPTLAFRGQCFWGSDTIAWANAFVDMPEMFDSGEMKRAAEIGIGAARKEVR